MQRKFLSPYLVFFLFQVPSVGFGIDVFGPNIQCTVVKVYARAEVMGLNSFPKRYQAINNTSTSSKLMIDKKEIKNLSPVTVIKKSNYEKIIIKHTTGQLELELHGEPMSRQGTLKNSGTLLADITCH